MGASGRPTVPVGKLVPDHMKRDAVGPIAGFFQPATKSTGGPEERFHASALGQLRKAIGAPAFAAHPVMHGEEAVGIVLMLHGKQPRIIRAPKGLSPRLVKEIASARIVVVVPAVLLVLFA